MAYIDFDLTPKRAHELNGKLLHECDQWVGSCIVYQEFPKFRLEVGNPRYTIDYLIELGLVDPTKDSYIIHD